MTKKRIPADPQPAATVGKEYLGRLPSPVDCEGYVAESSPICTEDQWHALGCPVVSVRYTLSYGADPYGYTYCYTGLRPDHRVALRLITPSNCAAVEAGVITPAGEHWVAARLRRVGDRDAARDYVRRRVGSDQPICYWDHLLSPETCARYILPDGTLTTRPVMPVGSDPDDPAALLRAADDGNPWAADPEPETEA